MGLPHWTRLSSHLCTFWGYVQLFCKMVLQSSIFCVKTGGSGTDNGFGLWARKACDNLAITHELVGLVEPLTPEEVELFTNTYKYKSLISIDRDVTAILYGPLSLVNNDNHSAFQFIDRDYLTDMPMFAGLHAQHIETWYPTAVTTLDHIRAVKLISTESCYVESGEQINCWYKDSNFHDYFHDSSDEEKSGGDGDVRSSKKKKAKKNHSLHSTSNDDEDDYEVIAVTKKKKETKKSAAFVGSNPPPRRPSVATTAVVKSEHTAVKLENVVPQLVSAGLLVEDHTSSVAVVSRRTPSAAALLSTAFVPPPTSDPAAAGMKRLRIRESTPRTSKSSSTAGISAQSNKCCPTPAAPPNDIRRFVRSYVADTYDEETQLEFTPENNSSSSSSSAVRSRPTKGGVAAAGVATADNIKQFFERYVNGEDSGDDAGSVYAPEEEDSQERED